jgi:hypothetical protein
MRFAMPYRAVGVSAKLTTGTTVSQPHRILDEGVERKNIFSVKRGPGAEQRPRLTRDSGAALTCGGRELLLRLEAFST